MKKKIKKSFVITLALAVVLCLAGCNGTVRSNSIFIRYSNDYELPDETAGIVMNPGQLVHADIENVNERLKAEFPEEELSVVPVYYNLANVFTNDEIIYIYGVDPNHASHLGLEEMADGTAYFANEQSGELELEICVLTEETPEGCTFGETAYMTLNAQTGVSEKGLLKVLEDEYFMPSMLEEQICFVTTDTFLDIASASLSVEMNTLEEAENASSIIKMIGMYVCTENIQEVRACLTELKYN